MNPPTFPTLTDADERAVVVAERVEYGQRRLYPVTATAYALARIADRRTLTDADLQTAARDLNLTVRILRATYA
jgi:hypothetical protein